MQQTQYPQVLYIELSLVENILQIQEMSLPKMDML